MLRKVYCRLIWLLLLSLRHFWSIKISISITYWGLVWVMMWNVMMRVMRGCMRICWGDASSIWAMTMVARISQSRIMMAMLTGSIFWIVYQSRLILNCFGLVSFAIRTNRCLIIRMLLIINNWLSMLDLLNWLRLFCWGRPTASNIDHPIWNFLNSERRLLLVLKTLNLSLVRCNAGMISYPSCYLIWTWLL